HHVYGATLDESPADRLFGGAGIGGGVGHHEPSPPFVAKRTGEDLNPEVVRVIDSRKTEREPLVLRELLLVNFVDIKGRVRHDEVELADTLEGVLVVRVGLTNIAREPVDCEIHLAEPDRLGNALLAVNGDLGRGVLLVVLDEASAL